MKILAFMIKEEHKQVVGFSALILYTVNLLMLLHRLCKEKMNSP